MNPVLKNILGITILVIAIAITLGFLFSDLTQKSFYDESGVIKVTGLKDSVSVLKDNFGVPHIYSNNKEDMYFAQGYMHARDRLWQMDLSRRVAEGRLSEIFGKDVLDYDILFRTLGIYKTAYQLMDKISPESKTILESYTKGVNAFIETHNKNLPLEFDILNYKPEAWKPEHSLMVMRMMAWELNLSWYTDYMFGEIVSKLGIEKAKEFFPEYPEDGPFIVQDKTSSKDTSNKNNKPTSFIHSETNYKQLSSLSVEFFESVKNYKNYFNISGSSIGSNSWVVSSKKSESEKPILANDPHLFLSSPSKWYEVHLYDNSSKSSVAGFSIPGTPLVAIGSNNIITWGITNLMNDDSDFYILDLNPENKLQYKVKETYHSLDSTEESIKIKDVKDTYDFRTYSTKFGPVISRLNKRSFSQSRGFNQPENKIVTFRWTGYELSDEINALYKINTAKNKEEFRTALSVYGTPAVNFTYADTAGNIGYQVAGKIAVRNNPENLTQMIYPSSGELEWTGFVPYDELPNEYNPERGFIITANNKPVKNYKYYISNLYEPHYRAEKIEQELESRSIFSADEFKLIQINFSSLQAKEFCQYIFDAFKDSNAVPQEYLKYFDLLKKWDYQMTSFSPAATIFAQFEIHLYKNLYYNVLGQELFNDYLYLKNIPVRNTGRLLKVNKSWLFSINQNDISIATARDYYVRKSFVEAIKTLTDFTGTDDYNNWLWGNYHKVTITHPLGVVPALSGIVNIGPFEMGGSGVTINCGEYSFSNALASNEFGFSLGASMRMIVDLGRNKNLYTIIPGGQSGQPLHINYADQARLWLNGEYKTVTTDFNELIKQEIKILKLEP